jgi:protein TonB
MLVHPRQATVLYSAVVHTILLTVVVLLPLWFTEALEPAKLLSTMLVAPPQMMSAPPPPAAAQTAAATPPVPRVFTLRGKLLFPKAIPRHAAVISEGDLEPAAGASGVFGGVYGGVPGDLGAGLFGTGAEPPAPPPSIPAEPVVEQPHRPLQVGGNVLPPKLIRRVDPIYPNLARQARVQGDVLLSAIINENGYVTELKVISGPPLLYAAALDAVRQWKFQPTYLNNRPWPIAYEITVHFRI